MSQQQSDPKKRISCKRCQDRKIKCSRTSPCQRCTAAGVRCEFRGDGLKRAPISREYVTALENRIEALEGFLSDLKSAPSCEQEGMVKAIEFGGQLPTPSASSALEPFDTQGSDVTYHGRSIARLDYESMIYRGPSSLCSSKLVTSAGQMPSTCQIPPISSIFVDANANFPRHIVNECLTLFFRWQYPQCMFLDREEFSLDYSNRLYTGEHSSTALEYAVCALGALMSSDMRIRGLADSFSAQATRKLELESLLNPQEGSINALIFCSIYQIGKGDFSKASTLSGTAFRMSEDLADRDQTQRYFDGQPSTPRELDCRRRTFANCSKSDKFPLMYPDDRMISLLLGRPAVIYEKTSAIHQGESEETSPTPNTPPEHRSQHNLQESGPSSDLSAVSKRHGELCHIINDMLETHPSNRRPTRQPMSQRWTEVVINKLNASLWKWHNSLPPALRWNRWGSILNAVHPRIATLHMLYHTAHISLNLPFLTSETTGQASLTLPAKPVTEAIQICRLSVDTIISILRRFKSQHTLKNAPLEFVQGTIAAADAAIATASFDTSAGLLTQDANLRALDEALLELSYSWQIAGDARTGLHNVLAGLEVSKDAAISSPSRGYGEQESPVSSGPESLYDHPASSLTSGYPLEALEPNVPNVFSFEPIDTSPYVWDRNLLNGSVAGSGGIGVGDLPNNAVASYGNGVDEGLLMSLLPNSYEVAFGL